MPKKKKKVSNFKLPISKILIFFIVLVLFSSLIFAYYFKLSKNTALTDINVTTPYGTCSSAYESKWGNWCVYTHTDSEPDKVIGGFDNIYHSNVYFRNGKWNMYVGGWKNASAQGWHDKIFKLQTNDIYGISGWTLVKNPTTGSDYYVDNNFENTNSYIVSPELNGKLGSGNPYVAKHSVQPAIFASENYPYGITCCDTLYYAYDAGVAYVPPAFSPENYATINWLYMDSVGRTYKAGGGNIKNPSLTYRDYWNSGDTNVVSVSDPNTVYDPKTKRFYIVYAEWGGRNSSNRINVTIGLASAAWTSAKYSVVAKNIIPVIDNIAVSNPQIVISPDSKYYLFYTRFTTHYGIKDGNENEFRYAVADDITGPYVDRGIALKPPYNDGKLSILTTPYVFCNKLANRWQMYFSYATGALTDNQVYTAFLEKNCSQPPY